jgi:hypothetical protein
MDPMMLGCLGVILALAIGATIVVRGRRAKRAGWRG